MSTLAHITGITSHVSSNGTVRIWNNGKLTIKQKELSPDEVIRLKAAEGRRKAMNARIEGRPLIADDREDRLFGDIFKPVENTFSRV